MIHQVWENSQTIKKVECTHTNAKKYTVKKVLSVGKTYEVKNETEEFYFIIDNTGRIGGYLKDYFSEVK